MKFLKLIPVLMILVLVSCSKEESSDLILDENKIETRRDWRVVGGGSNNNNTSNYDECDNINFVVQSGMYNQLENVICCNYSTGESNLEVLVTGADDSHDTEWNVQGTSIIQDLGLSVITGVGCPAVGDCAYLTFQFFDHTLKCKSTFNVEVCNNVGDCFTTTYDPDCEPGESALECLCRKYPDSPQCDGFGEGV